VVLDTVGLLHRWLNTGACVHVVLDPVAQVHTNY
jgi:hypothetical protein